MYKSIPPKTIQGLTALSTYGGHGASTPMAQQAIYVLRLCGPVSNYLVGVAAVKQQ
jgi:hypothetical protein